MSALVLLLLASGAHAQIIHGEAADLETYPSAGALLVERAVMCSSSLIAPDVVLLAAHCVDPTVVGGGEYRWTTEPDLAAWADGGDDWPADAVPAGSYVMHPSWVYAELETGLAENDDIALLFLDEALPDAPRAVLPSPEEALEVAVGREVHIVGWGMTSADGGLLGVKHWGTSTIDELATWEFQVGEDSSDTRKCHGDSGGPSYMAVETSSYEVMRVVGVTSHAYDETDCQVTGGVDTRVDHYLEWIDGELRAACADGTRAWCRTEGILPAPWTLDDLDIDLVGCTTSPATPWLALAPILLLVRRRRY